MKKVHSICYWLVGNAVAIDLHAENGDLIRPDGFDESASFALKPSKTAQEARAKAKTQVLAYAREFNVAPGFVFYDGDSTDWESGDAHG